MIVLNEKSLGIWFMQVSPDADWMGHLGLNDEGEYEFIYRHRYYVDNKTHDSDDKKSWYKGTVLTKDTPVDVVITLVQSVVKTMSNFHGDSTMPVHELLMGDKTIKEFTAEFKKLPFVHYKMERLH